MQTTTKITFVAFLLAASTLSISSAKASPTIQANTKNAGNIEYRLSRITKAIEKINIELSNSLDMENGERNNSLARGFANRGGGGFANRGGGGFVNRGGGGFANRGGGGFANGGGGGFVNRSPFRNGGGFYNRY
ncbi:MAG: GrrA/OscA1 family cyclophane-containing rSAM-modified RiPP [Crocosphaera sp.]|nr:GrrA/OscA1 family cyclophane-containing rSAM-modified RiPP [Crocosphaera sp.]